MSNILPWPKLFREHKKEDERGKSSLDMRARQLFVVVDHSTVAAPATIVYVKITQQKTGGLSKSPTSDQTQGDTHIERGACCTECSIHCGDGCGFRYETRGNTGPDSPPFPVVSREMGFIVFVLNSDGKQAGPSMASMT